MHRGFIRLWRKIDDCQSASRGLAYIGAMSWLLSKARHQSAWVGGQHIERGQLAVTRSELSYKWKVSEQTVRTILKNLESDGFLTIKSTNKFSLITIENWAVYQGDDAEANQQINQQANQQLTNNQPTTNHIQEYKNIKKDKINYLNADARRQIIKQKSEQILKEL